MTSKITVHVRLRKKSKTDSPWHVTDNTLYQILDRTTKLSYICYQNVYQNETTSDIYEKAIKTVIIDLLDGKNATVFAYGQTGSGKTHTMLGNNSEPGLIRLTIKEIIEKEEIEMSYLEIYNENIFDLTDYNKSVKVYGSNSNFQLSNLARIPIQTMEEAMNIIKECEERRRVSHTEFNERSSRSHTVFQIHLKNGKSLSLIDLAGSEKASDSLERRKEGAFINRSLLALGSVINKLVSNEYVNFRDSKLTRILQQSLDGSSNVVSLCMISPDKRCVAESINTLKFAARLSKVELKQRHDIEEMKNNDQFVCIKCKENDKIKFKEESKKIKFEELNDVTSEVEEELKNNNMILKAENDLYLERIKILEDTVKSLLNSNSSKRVNDLFILEKNMFQLQLEIIKRKKKPANAL